MPPPAPPDQKEATEFFTTAARNLQQAGAERGVEGILVVSIIGTDHFNTGYNAAKVVQERIQLSGLIRRSARRAVPRVRRGTARVGNPRRHRPSARNADQAVAARTVAEALADLVDGAASAPIGNPVAEVAGPREENLLEVARLLAAERGNGLRIEAGEFFEDPEGLICWGGPARPGGQARRPHLRGVGDQAPKGEPSPLAPPGAG